jgi:4-aminobutyrate aminotransferase/(S)-3-amino-2-methylpropionate transaminase
MQAAGFYHNLELRPNMPFRQYGTWMGDPIRALQARGILNIIAKDKLVEHTASLGNYIYGELDQLRSDNIVNLRGQGQGTFIAWDAQSPGKRDELIKRMKAKGVHLGGCGERVCGTRKGARKRQRPTPTSPLNLSLSISFPSSSQAVRLRPMLVFEKHHADLFLTHLSSVLKEM